MSKEPIVVKDGLRLESAASLTIRDAVQQHLHVFAHVIRTDRVAGKSTHAEYVNGLAGVTALLIAGGHGSRDDIINGTVAKLREYIDRDLRHLARQ